VRTANVRLRGGGHLRGERGRGDVVLEGGGVEMCEWGKCELRQGKKKGGGGGKSYIDFVVSCSWPGIECKCLRKVCVPER
jgi:hypothetical protein